MRIDDIFTLKNYDVMPFVSDFKIKAETELPVFSVPDEVEGDFDTFEPVITPQGVKDKAFLKYAPDPNIKIAGENKKAGIIVDIKSNVLYRYDKDGNPINAYLIASGKKSTPTDRGVRIVTHTEKSPYRSAIGTKRKRNPENYGPFAIILKKIDTKTGNQSNTGEFIHGCKKYEDTFESDPGRYVSGGCMRMDNSVIEKLALNVKKGEIVIIK